MVNLIWEPRFGDVENKCLTIQGFTSTGAAAKFNADNPAEKIEPGDVILKTDEVYMDGQKMVEYIKEKTSVGACIIKCTVWRNMSI